MRSQEAPRLGVAILAAALLALTWIPAAAAPAPTIVDLNDYRLTAGYVVYNPCTGTQNITLSGYFSITGRVTFYNNGTTKVDLRITPNFSGTDTAGVIYTSTRWMQVGYGTLGPKASLTSDTPFEAIPQDGSPHFYFKVRFDINRTGTTVTFNLDNSMGAYGFNGVLCPR